MAEAKRMTISFSAPVMDDLDWLIERRKESQTDTVNRSVRMHAMIERELAKGRNILFENPETGVTERIVIV